MRIAYFLTHPTQNQAPFIRDLIARGLDITTVYAGLAANHGYHDSEFRRTIAWDVPVLAGHPYTAFDEAAPVLPPKHDSSWYNSRVSRWIANETPDVVWLHGWSHAFCRAVWAVANAKNIPVILRGETSLECVKGPLLTRTLHRLYYARKFKRVSGFLSIGTLNHKLYESYGVPEKQICLVPYMVDDDFFSRHAAALSNQRQSLRESLGITSNQPVLFFCGKLIEEKGVESLIRAVSVVASESRLKREPPPVLILAGEGALRSKLESLAADICASEVRFIGFCNQTELPAYYDLCDLFILPSRFEPWGLVVNEAMAVGRPVIVSDAVGCRVDLVRDGQNGSVFGAGDPTALAAAIRFWLADRTALRTAGQASKEILRAWRAQFDVQKIKNLLTLAIQNEGSLL